MSNNIPRRNLDDVAKPHPGFRNDGAKPAQNQANVLVQHENLEREELRELLELERTSRR